jgi:hypothetical protein
MPITFDGTNSTVTGGQTDPVPSGVITSSTLNNAAVTRAKMSFVAGEVVQMQYLNSTTRVSLGCSNTYTEPSSNYRVSITPVYSNSLMVISYHVPISFPTWPAPNYICRYHAVRFVSGTPNNISSCGNQSYSGATRAGLAGFSTRASNGFNGSDGSNFSLTLIDLPGTTSAIQYGFQVATEGVNNQYLGFGYSVDQGSGNSIDSNIIIVVQEIKQ